MMDKHIFIRRVSRQRSYGVISVIVGILGMFCGALAAHLLDSGRFQVLYQYLTDYFQQDLGQLSIKLVYQTLGQANVLAVLKLLFLGFCLIGAPFIVIQIFTKGFSLGFTWSLLWQGLLIKEAIAAVGALFLAQCVPVVLFLASGAYALQSSWELFLGQSFTDRLAWLRYLLTGAAFVVAMVAASCLEGFLLYDVFADLLSKIFSINE